MAPSRSAAPELDALFAAPPGEFTRTRNRLAAELRAAGRDRDAAELRRWRRPSAALWAVNQLARRHPRALEEFAESVRALRRGPLGPPPSGRDAMLAPLLERIRAALADAELPTSRETVERASSTLWAAALDEARRRDLLAGRLREELALPGFEVFAGPPAPAVPRPAKPPRDAAAERRERDRERKARAARQAAEREVARLERRAVQLERREQAARAAAEEASRLAARAREEAGRAADRVKDAAGRPGG